MLAVPPSPLLPLDALCIHIVLRIIVWMWGKRSTSSRHVYIRIITYCVLWEYKYTFIIIITRIPILATHHIHSYSYMPSAMCVMCVCARQPKIRLAAATILASHRAHDCRYCMCAALHWHSTFYRYIWLAPKLPRGKSSCEKRIVSKIELANKWKRRCDSKHTDRPTEQTEEEEEKKKTKCEMNAISNYFGLHRHHTHHRKLDGSRKKTHCVCCVCTAPLTATTIMWSLDSGWMRWWWRTLAQFKF